MTPRDPRLRPYRTALWIVYFAVLLLGIGLMAASIARSLRGPSRPARAAGALPTHAALRVCLADLELLYREQNERAWALGDDLERPDPFVAWAGWSRGWEERVDDLSDRCRLDDGSGDDAPARRRLAGARDAILALHRAYSAHVNRFAQEEGQLVTSAQDALASARLEVARTR